MLQTLYLGLELPFEWQDKDAFHYPIIKIVPKPISDPLILSAFMHFDMYTHLVFTSKSAIPIFFQLMNTFGIQKRDMRKKTIVAVGQKTAARLKEHEVDTALIALEESSEGIVSLLNSQRNSLIKSHLFIPQSSLARPILREWLTYTGIPHTICPIYDTHPNIQPPLPDLASFHQIVFTSPSTVDAFLQGYGNLPRDKILKAIGPITEHYLARVIHG